MKDRRIPRSSKSIHSFCVLKRQGNSDTKYPNLEQVCSLKYYINFYSYIYIYIYIERERERERERRGGPSGEIPYFRNYYVLRPVHDITHP
jgi:hypothetical protein